MDLLSEELLIVLAICLALALIGFKYRQPAVMFVSSLGELLVAFELYSNGSGVLVMGLMIMLAVAQTMVVLR